MPINYFGAGGGAATGGSEVTAGHATDDTYEGMVITGLNAGATIAQWEAVYLGASSKWLLADANGASTYPARGLAVTSAVDTGALNVVTHGTVRNDAWAWTVGGSLYLSGTPGGLTQTRPATAGDAAQPVGFALTADIAFFQFGEGEFLTAPANVGNFTSADITVNAKGQVTAAANGSGGGGTGTKTYAFFTASHNQPPATAFATLDTRNSIAVLDFDDTTEEAAVFVGIMPEGASLGSGLIVNLKLMATTATTGDLRFGVQFERGTTDLDADSWDTATEATLATSGTTGIAVSLSITATAIDSIVAGDLYRIRVYRDTSGADTVTGDAELIAVEVRSAA